MLVRFSLVRCVARHPLCLVACLALLALSSACSTTHFDHIAREESHALALDPATPLARLVAENELETSSGFVALDRNDDAFNTRLAMADTALLSALLGGLLCVYAGLSLARVTVPGPGRTSESR